MKPIRRKSERGNAMLEFALGWSILWLMFAGVYQIGYAYYVYNVLSVSIANAAEFGSRLSYDTSSPSTYTTAVTNMVLYGDETVGTHTVVPNLTSSNVIVSVNADAAGMPRDVTVNITDYTINALFTSFSLPNKPSATTLYYGLIACSSC
jgi:Flp pilus assembly protein TadG